MIVIAICFSIIWLLLLVIGIIKVKLPDHLFMAQIMVCKQQAKLRHNAALGRNTKPYKRLIKRNKANKSTLPKKYIYAPGYALYEWIKLEQRAPMLIQMLHSCLLQQHRYQWSFEQTVYLLNEALGQALLVIVAGGWLAYISNEPVIALVSILAAIVLILQLYQGVKNGLLMRKRAMLIELPKLLTQLTLLVGAGDSVHQGFVKCIKTKLESKHPLYVEWQEAVYELNNGASFVTVVEKLNRNCAFQQMSMLSTILLLNYRRGGEYFISAVQELNLSLWEARKTTARIKGEEASSKMIFPLVGILFLLMVLVIAPAVLMMQGM